MLPFADHIELVNDVLIHEAQRLTRQEFESLDELLSRVVLRNS